jgi:uncharacterized membrane protein
VRVALGLFLMLLPFAALGLVSCAAQFVGSSPKSSEVSVTLAIFALPFALGVYLLMGPSRVTKKGHLVFAGVGLLFLALTVFSAWSAPKDFDLGIVVQYVLIFGAVYLGIFAVGYVKAPNKPDVDWFSEIDGKPHDDRLR